MAKFKKTILVEAEQFLPDRQPWPDGVKRHTYCSAGDGGYCEIHQLNHEQVGYTFSAGPFDRRFIDPEWWIVRHADGETEIVGPHVFASDYESVE